MKLGLTPKFGILPDRSPVWGFAGTAWYGNLGGDTGINYYVDQNNDAANDDNLGTDPYAPLETIQQAIDLSNATIDWTATPKIYNTIWVAPGVYAENLTPAYYCVIVGTGQLGTDTATEIHPAAGSALTGTGLGLVLQNLRFEVETAVPVLDFGICNNSAVIGCELVRGIAGLATMAVQTDNATHLWLIENRVISGVANFPTGFQFLGGANKFLHASLIYHNWIFAATTGIDIPANCTASGTVIEKNIVVGRPVTGIQDLNGNTYCIDNWVTASVDGISHVNLATNCIANHVIDATVGTVEAANTD